MTDPGIQASVRGGVRDAAAATAATAAAGEDKTSVAAAATAVIPVGSLEQHGPHLPVSTDSVIASEVSRMVAEQNSYLLMPVIAYGVSYEHAPLFNASTSPDSLSRMISDLCGSLYESGICNIIIINGHHGNMEALGRLERLVKDSTGSGGPAVRVFNYWRYMQRQQELGHAGFAETSMMLAISAGSVRMDLAQKGLVTDGMPPERVREISELAKRSFPEATGNGVWGDPAGATAEAGRRLLGESADGISGECAEWLGGRAAQAG